jgi:arylsulfatase A-like enzyme
MTDSLHARGLRAAITANLFAFSFAIAAVQANAQQSARVEPLAQPNVILLLADDLDVSVFDSGLGADLYPNIRALMATATTFTNNFASISSCCPSRATYLTGLYSHNHGTIRNSGPHGGFASFKDTSTLATWMKDGGYRTGLMGKYLNGYGGSDAGYTPPGWDTWNALLDLAQYNYEMTVPGGTRLYGSAPQDYQTDVLADRATQFVRTGAEPFFLMLTPTAPHLEGEKDYGVPGKNGIRPAPRHASTPDVPLPVRNLVSFNEQDMGDKPRWMRGLDKASLSDMERVFNEKRAALRSIDDMVGKLVTALKADGRWDNTLFAFASDNGFQYSTHRRGLRKIDFYEESIRIPLIVKAPNQTTAFTSSAWVLSNDWAPTAMDYAGLTRGDGKAFDGRSLRPYMQGQAGGRRTVLIEMPPEPRTAAVVIGEGVFKPGAEENDDHPSFFAIRTKDPALTLDATGKDILVFAQTYDDRNRVNAEEQYDLQNDPYQVKSVHRSSNTQIAKQRKLMRERLQAIQICKAATCKTLED